MPQSLWPTVRDHTLGMMEKIRVGDVARGSGTNDKAGSILNLVRWISPRTIMETFAPPHAFEYPFMSEK